MEFTPYASGSTANAYTVTEGAEVVLIEMGLPIKSLRKALHFGLSTVKFALLSHCHQDHAKSVQDVMSTGVDVYTSQGTIDALGLSGHRIHAVKAEQQFQVGEWRIVPVNAEHDAPEPLAYFVSSPTRDRLLFATDTYYLQNRFHGLNIIAIECNYATDILQANVEAGLIDTSLRNRLYSSHFSLDNVKKFLLANDLSQVREIYLLHLSDSNSDELRFQHEVQAVTGVPTYIA